MLITANHCDKYANHCDESVSNYDFHYFNLLFTFTEQDIFYFSNITTYSYSLESCLESCPIFVQEERVLQMSVLYQETV